MFCHIMNLKKKYPKESNLLKRGIKTKYYMFMVYPSSLKLMVIILYVVSLTIYTSMIFFY